MALSRVFTPVNACVLLHVWLQQQREHTILGWRQKFSSDRLLWLWKKNPRLHSIANLSGLPRHPLHLVYTRSLYTLLSRSMVGKVCLHETPASLSNYERKATPIEPRQLGLLRIGLRLLCLLVDSEIARYTRRNV